MQVNHKFQGSIGQQHFKFHPVLQMAVNGFHHLSSCDLDLLEFIKMIMNRFQSVFAGIFNQTDQAGAIPVQMIKRRPGGTKA